MARTLFTLLAAGSAVVQATPIHSIFKRATNANTYLAYSGDGTVEQGWPSQAQWWPSVDAMFTANTPTISESCAQFSVPNNSDQETSDILTAIKSVASSTGVDARFILAIMMQESNGCVRVPTTNGGVVNPGLMQDHDGAASCNDGGSVTNPCPQSTITQMIQEGTGGTSAGAGLQQCIAQASTQDNVAMYYEAARIYNSGSVSSDGNLGEGVATHCYASDVANRLTGWVSGTSSCSSGTIGTEDGTASGATGNGLSGSSSGSSGSTPTSTTTPTTPTSTSTPAQTYVPAPAATSATPAAPAPAESSAPAAAPVPPFTAPDNTPPSSGTANSASSAEIAPGVVSDCTKFYTVQSGDSCWTVEQANGLTFEQFQAMNTAIDSTCSNLWLGYQYCIGT